MIALAAALAVAGVLPLDELPPQRLAPQQCALFLWDRDSQRRIAMASSAPPAPAAGASPGLTIVTGGRIQRLAATDSAGVPVLGFAPHASYRGGDLTITTDLGIEPTPVGGAIVRDGTLTLTLADGTTVVVPVAGLIGCQ